LLGNRNMEFYWLGICIAKEFIRFITVVEME
jgi:hypothetical protein